MIPEFEDYWDMEVKPLALKCCEKAGLISQLEKATTDAEKEAIRNEMVSAGIKDWHTLWYIRQMMIYVEHDLADNRPPGIRMFQVHGCLNDEDYYRNVFQGQENEEAKNYRELGRKLNRALDLLF